MLNPLDPATGRSLLIFAAIIFGFGLFWGVTRQTWQDATLLLSIAVFMGCYGTIMLNALPRLHRWLLLIGLVAGGTAFMVAVFMVLEL
jgi:hypothetical protein